MPGTTSDSRVAVAFLKAFNEDRLAGREHDLAHYLARFSGNVEIVAREFLRLHEARTPGPLATDNRIGRYRLLELLGHGGQADVYLAEDEQLQRRVAVKILEREVADASPAAGMRLLREAQVVSRLRDPGICPVHDTGTADGRAFVVMEHVAGESLASLLGKAQSAGDKPPLDLPGTGSGLQRVLRFLERVARSVHVAHAAGVVHRDIKPANIMVTAAGDPVILDFGLALEQGEDTPALTVTGSALGTPSYMAPEQVRADRKRIGCGTDVWALGVVLYECLTFCRPFEAAGTAELYQAILSEEPVLAPIPRALRSVVACALAKNPERRYLSAADLANDLCRVIAGEATTARLPGIWFRLLRLVRRHPGVIGVLTILILSLSMGLWFAERMFAREHRLRKQAERAFEDQRRLRKEADFAFHQLHKLSNSMVFEIHNAVRDLPGAAPARRLLLQRALDYLKVLEQRAVQDPSLNRDLAAAWVGLGDVQGHPGTQSLGDRAAAENSYRTALAIYQQLVPLPGATVADHALLLLVRTRLADLALAGGWHQETGRELVRVIRTAEALLARHGDDPQLLKVLFSARSTAGLASRAQRQHEACAGHVQAAVLAARRWVRASPDELQPQTCLAGALTNLGLLREQQGDRTAALALQKQARDRLVKLAERFPGVEVQNCLTAALVPLARLQAMAGHPEQAQESIEQAIAAQERLARLANNHPLVLRRLCTAYAVAIPILQPRAGKTGVDRSLDRVLDRYRERSAQVANGSGSSRSDWVVALRAELLWVQHALELGRMAAAKLAWQRIPAWSSRLQEEPPPDWAAIRIEMARLAGHVARLSGDTKAARRRYRECLELCGPGFDPPGLRAEVLFSLALAEHDAGAVERARATARRARDAQSTAPARLPGHDRWLQALAAEWAKRAR